MIQGTLDRLGDSVPPENRFILTNQDLVDAVAEQLPGLPPANIIGEPAKRDTAPCVGLAAAIVQHQDPDGIMVVMPSDHVIDDVAAFQDAIAAGVKLIEEDPSRIVTFGIKPSYPAESFGYIERGDAIGDANAYQVSQFREKPDGPTATKYVEAGSFYWNSGIFLWKASTITEALDKNVPEIQKHIHAIASSMNAKDYDEVLQKEFTAIKGTSIDYAVMETYDNVVVIEAPFDWDDVGSWQAIARMHPADEQGNTVVGSHLGIDTSGCIVRTHGDHTVVTIDVDDLIIVQTEDATLVAKKSSEERVREVVAALQERSLDNRL